MCKSRKVCWWDSSRQYLNCLQWMTNLSLKQKYLKEKVTYLMVRSQLRAWYLRVNREVMSVFRCMRNTPPKRLRAAARCFMTLIVYWTWSTFMQNNQCNYLCCAILFEYNQQYCLFHRTLHLKPGRRHAPLGPLVPPHRIWWEVN